MRNSIAGWVAAVLLAAALLFSSTARAQAATPSYATGGQLEIEGGLAFQYTAVEDVSTWSFTLAPAARYFIFKGLAVGAGMGLTMVKDGPTAFSLLPQAEYNFNLGGRLFPYVRLGFGFQFLEVDTPLGEQNNTDAILEVGGGIKITFGGGLLGLGLHAPIAFSDPLTLGINILTRYAIYF